MSSVSPLSPNFYGHIASTQDALLLFEVCLGGTLNPVARRPHDRERASSIQSRNVFIYEEQSSRIKRWTDGVPWTPSRILGNFLVYRELERPFPPGEKKRAMKRSKWSSRISKPEPYDSSSSSISGCLASVAAPSFDSLNGNSISKEAERSLIGSLVDSYGFKEEGLIKKTVSVIVGGVSYHLISYYTIADVMNNKFTTPSKNPRFQHIIPRANLVTKQNFWIPIDEVELMDRIDDNSVYAAYPYTRNGYEMTTTSHRPMYLPIPPTGYTPRPNFFPINFNFGTPSTTYNRLSQSASSAAGYGSQFAPSLGAMYLGTGSQNYGGGYYRQ